ncbi:MULTISPECIES: DUF1192 domain-containing protein [Pseudovibrio]|uniref:DUF1192 domain-containing protein n=1 Tax=Stappiaceae TaxID=2821832 RepID=UPI0023662E74|nr:MULTISPECIES: DUF1192 domain-containing protein [Pseudovibrio]MDD7911893.1 DUF1192 domain-containing protein [Pseudovibrio exalbescens]MDX5595441.1 DUF1192 domain-containing protein [Pseudovibrio sp. SPO723]
MGLFDDDEPQKKSLREIVVGESLENLSVTELKERISNLHAEIARTEKELESKASASQAAQSLFK